MARWAVVSKGQSIRRACADFQIGETRYRYRAKHSSENDQIAEWLTRVTENQRNWGFGLCFLYLRNVKGYGASAAPTTEHACGDGAAAVVELGPDVPRQPGIGPVVLPVPDPH